MRLFLSIVLVLLSCNPVDYVSDKAAERASEECTKIFDEKFPEIRQQIEDQIWDLCTGFYDQVIIPSLSDLLDGLTIDIIVSLEDRFKLLLLEAEMDVMNRMGCTEDPANPSGWNCTGTFICQ